MIRRTTLTASCAAAMIAAATAAAQVDFEDAFINLTFSNPVDIQAAGDGSNRLFIVQQPGIIAVVENDPAATESEVFLDIQSQVVSGAEQGLLGMVFHPAYPDSPYFYVNYTAPNPERTVVSRFAVSDSDPDSANVSSEFVILEVGQPFPNHNAGQLAFGADGYLYIGLGDGGDAGDPLENAQDRTVLLGKMLRIDVDAASGSANYQIPPDNPYVGNTEGYREEIWAYGFRNPWRYSFDTVTGRLWLGDVGQDLYEEIDVVTRGGNYGWDIVEGDSCFEPPAGCDTTGLVAPVWSYPHGNGHISVTGGYVYRGSGIPALNGRYVYADFGAGTIYAIQYDGTTALNDTLVDTGKLISSFGVDESGELYFAALFDGNVYRLTSTATSVGQTMPRTRARLAPNVPNPFNPGTTIAFETSATANVAVEIFDVHGRRVASLMQQRVDRGPHSLSWNGRSSSGTTLPSGVYFCRLLVDGTAADTRRMVLLK